MEFRSPTVAAQQNAKAAAYLTRNLSDPGSGRRLLDTLVEELGNAVDCGSAWKRDPGSGVIGVEKGPLIPVV